MGDIHVPVIKCKKCGFLMNYVRAGKRFCFRCHAMLEPEEKKKAKLTGEKYSPREIKPSPKEILKDEKSPINWGGKQDEWQR